MNQSPDSSWFARWMSGIDKRVFKLEHPPIRPIRETLLFQFRGSVTESIDISDPYPIFDDGYSLMDMIFATKQMTDATVGFSVWICSTADGSGDYTLVGAYTVEANLQKKTWPLNIPVNSGDLIAVSVPNVGNPASPMNGLSIGLRTG